MRIWRCALLVHNRVRGLFGRRDGFHRVTPGQRMHLRLRSIFPELGLSTLTLIALGFLFAVNSASAQVHSGPSARALITEKIDEAHCHVAGQHSSRSETPTNDRGAVADNFTMATICSSSCAALPSRSKRSSNSLTSSKRKDHRTSTSGSRRRNSERGLACRSKTSTRSRAGSIATALRSTRSIPVEC